MSGPRLEQLLSRPPETGGHGELDELTRDSVDGLRAQHPVLSAATTWTRWQLATVVGAVAVLVVAAVLAPRGTARVLVALATLGYTITLLYRVLLFRWGMRGAHLLVIEEAAARAVPDADLPVYTVLVPAYAEPTVIGRLLDSLAALDYPVDKLDVQLLLEADDTATIEAARAAVRHPAVRLVLVPDAPPRTKPKACDVGLALARGEYVTIFDAEDRPEPLQLRRAWLALRDLGPRYACVQAQLGYFNAGQNLITRWFTIEYGSWFRFLLPGLSAAGAPIPLGGTSNHFRTDVLRDVGGWDPYNVTEDADLGVRLARRGYRVGVLDSATGEEANSDFVNWVKQRSRWYKGYLQTWLVHVRDPRALHREIGWRGALGLHLFVAGTPLVSLVNPLFWAFAVIWFAAHPPWLAALFPPSVFYVAMACAVLGNASVIYINVLTARGTGRPELLGAALLSPLYWLMMSVAAAKSVVQLVRQPSYWEKTTHGLDAVARAAPEAPTPGAQAWAGAEEAMSGGHSR